MWMIVDVWGVCVRVCMCASARYGFPTVIIVVVASPLRLLLVGTAEVRMSCGHLDF